MLVYVVYVDIKYILIRIHISVKTLLKHKIHTENIYNICICDKYFYTTVFRVTIKLSNV